MHRSLVVPLRTREKLSVQRIAIVAKRLTRLARNHLPVVPLPDRVLHALDRFRNGLGRRIALVRFCDVARLLRALAEIVQIFSVQKRHRVHQPQIILKREPRHRPMRARCGRATLRDRHHELLLCLQQTLCMIVQRLRERAGRGCTTALQPAIECARLLRERRDHVRGRRSARRFSQLCSNLVRRGVRWWKKILRQQLAVYVKVAHHGGGAADLLQLAQPALACLFRGLAQTARAGLACQRLERRLHAARAGAQMMD